MKLPKLDDLVDEQMLVYEHDPDENLFVAGPPGSGKTSLAVLRAKFLKELDKKVLLVTRNKMLAALAVQLDGDGLEASTMNSFIGKRYYALTRQKVPEPYPFAYDWQAVIDTCAAIDATPAWDHLIIDEGQNLPAGFFQWAVRFGGRNLTVFADEDQTTDSLRASLREIRDAGMPAPIRLQANHRNTAEIAAVAEHFHRSQILPPGIVQRRRGGELPRLVRSGSWDELVALVSTRYQNRAEAIGVIVYRRDDVLQVRDKLKAILPEGTRVDAYVSGGQGAPEDIRLLETGITVLSSESVIGLEFHAVYLQDLHRSLPCGSPEEFRRMYMLCARARDNLTLVDGPDALTANQIADLPGPVLLAR
ncbi:AAA family ATPase [Burkholderia ambifaria]|uniref:AAA family ATPase n=1 Tax=Burkholderia ambifaria TaxID=152480 RepID=UPI001E40E382|nr:AAA family ATPase [Burkholderia ambifaria]UEP38285.1 AAA family ATPase [Burkholderia ambifaria]